jgi:DNA-binding transcriptional regulator YiaG
MSAAPSSYGELADVLDALPLLVREARRARRLSVRATATQLGCSFSTVSRFENGKDVNLSNAAALLRWLDRPSPAVDHG